MAMKIAVNAKVRQKLKPLIEYLINLEPGEFWNQREFNHLSNANKYLKNQQETFWLKLLHALKNQQEKEALNLLKYNPFTTKSWFPELEIALKRILIYRQTGTLKSHFNIWKKFLPINLTTQAIHH